MDCTEIKNDKKALRKNENASHRVGDIFAKIQQRDYTRTYRECLQISKKRQQTQKKIRQEIGKEFDKGHSYGQYT